MPYHDHLPKAGGKTRYEMRFIFLSSVKSSWDDIFCTDQKGQKAKRHDCWGMRDYMKEWITWATSYWGWSKMQSLTVISSGQPCDLKTFHSPTLCLGKLQVWEESMISESYPHVQLSNCSKLDPYLRVYTWAYLHVFKNKPLFAERNVYQSHIWYGNYNLMMILLVLIFRNRVDWGMCIAQGELCIYLCCKPRCVISKWIFNILEKAYWTIHKRVQQGWCIRTFYKMKTIQMFAKHIMAKETERHFLIMKNEQIKKLE